MGNDIKSPLFATDLTGNYRPALENSVAIASRFQATLVFFHVIDGSSLKAEDHFISLIGKNKWEAIKEEREKVHATLTGKMSSSKQIRENIMSKYNEEAEIESLASKFKLGGDCG